MTYKNNRSQKKDIMSNIINISDINENYELWGGKAVGLCKLKENGFFVPEGFVISCGIYEKYINNTLDIIKFENLLKEYINLFFQAGEAIIFRSSANIEGIEGVCCCGVFDSIIHQESKEYIDDVKGIWDSITSEEALSYLKLMGINVENVKMAVIVQRIQMGIISGVLHTYDLIRDVKRTVIEFEYKTLNAVVDGSDNAERLVFDSDKNLIQGTYPKSVTRHCIDNLLVNSYEIENIFLEPIELEFQLKEEQVYFTQVRKLT